MDLFIGSEGTLGFITKAILKVIKSPEDSSVFLFSLDTVDSILPIFSEFRKSIHPLAFEIFTDSSLDYTLTNKSQFILNKRYPFYIIMEVEKSDKNEALLIFEKLLEKSHIKDGVLGENENQIKNIWKYRENITESISPYSPHKNDISVRVSKIPDFLREVEKILKKHYPKFHVIWFGHVGDGNIHINILKPQDIDNKEFLIHCEKVNYILFDLVKKYDGTISAEHGIGLLKKNYLNYSCSDPEISIMKKIKKSLDPYNIMNPGKVFDL